MKSNVRSIEIQWENRVRELDKVQSYAKKL